MKTTYPVKLVFIGRPGTIEVLQEGHRRVFWSWIGSRRIRFGPFISRSAALMDAAHRCGLSGRRADFCISHEEAKS